MITMKEIEPVAMAMATQNLFDKRFRSNFGDNLILRSRDPNLEPRLVKIKREMNMGATEAKYLQGHKMNIIFNIDRIIALVGRFASMDLRGVEDIVLSGKKLIEKVMNADDFDEIGEMEAMFKAQIMLPVYSLYVKKSKQSER
jgi:hypothetical protein